MQFDDTFLQTIGLGELSDEEKAEYIDKLGAIVQDRVAVRLSEELTPEELAAFDEATEKGDDEAMQYLAQVYPNFPSLIQGEVEGLKAEVARDAEQIRRVEQEIKEADAQTDSAS